MDFYFFLATSPLKIWLLTRMKRNLEKIWRNKGQKHAYPLNTFSDIYRFNLCFSFPRCRRCSKVVAGEPASVLSFIFLSFLWSAGSTDGSDFTGHNGYWLNEWLVDSRPAEETESFQRVNWCLVWITLVYSWVLPLVLGLDAWVFSLHLQAFPLIFVFEGLEWKRKKKTHSAVKRVHPSIDSICVMWLNSRSWLARQQTFSIEASITTDIK